MAIELTTTANTIAFIVLSVLTVLGIVVVAMSPESGSASRCAPLDGPERRDPARSAKGVLRRRARGRRRLDARRALRRARPEHGPQRLRLDSGLLNGLSGFIAPAASAVIGVSFARLDPRRAMTIGIYASIVGAIGIIGGVSASSLAIMFVGQAVAGVGFGASFTAALRLIFPLAAAHQRAGVVAGIYLVSYLGFGVPVVLAGQLASLIRSGADRLLVHRGDAALSPWQPPCADETRSSSVPVSRIRNTCISWLRGLCAQASHTVGSDIPWPQSIA